MMGLEGRRFRAAALLSAFGGFIALSYEILWFRVYLYASGGRANTFAFLLGAYLMGLAFGSLGASIFCKDDEKHTLALRAFFWLFGISQIAAFLTAPFVSYIVTKAPFAFSYVPAFVSAGLMGVTLPLVSHFGVRLSEGSVGQGVSVLYLANIVGSTLGSLVTGFWMLEHWQVGEISVVLAFSGLLMALAVLYLAGSGRRERIAGTAVVVCALLLLPLAGAEMFDGFYMRLFLKQYYKAGERFERTVTNRSGVINVKKDGSLYGGGVYDGVFSTDFVNDRNMIVRAYAIPAFHSAPEEVLVVGLGSGSWTKVIAANPAVKRITVVEINPGYLDVIKEYPVVSGILSDPKVEIVIDDGRRWLRAHPERKFDLIVQNTTYNWRMNATNILSMEYLELIRKHLKPGGINYYNTTGSWRVQRTGASVFPYALRFINFLAVSDSPVSFSTENWSKALMHYEIDGRKVLEQAESVGQRDLEVFLRRQTVSQVELRQEILRRTEGMTLVTDDNMGTEWEEKKKKRF